VVKEDIAIKAIQSPPICFKMEMGCESKADCCLGQIKSPSISSVSSPFGCTSVSEETEVQSMELVLNKEVSPSDSPMESTIDNPRWKNGELYSFLFDGHDTDSDDDIFPPTTIRLDVNSEPTAYPSIGATDFTVMDERKMTKIGKKDAEFELPRTHVPCRNLWEFM